MTALLMIQTLNSRFSQTLRPVLIKSRSTLVYDGSLTPNGTHVMHCIRNGILLGGIFLRCLAMLHD
jgi:hypothetical protein